jgi:hypothetical protein
VPGYTISSIPGAPGTPIAAFDQGVGRRLELSQARTADVTARVWLARRSESGTFDLCQNTVGSGGLFGLHIFIIISSGILSNGKDMHNI